MVIYASIQDVYLEQIKSDFVLSLSSDNESEDTGESGREESGENGLDFKLYCI